jgi:hypothetical protein
MATINTGYTWVSGNVVTPALLNQSVNSATVTNIVNADISNTAAIAGTKVAPNFGSQNMVTTGGLLVGTTTEFAVNSGSTDGLRVLQHGTSGGIVQASNNGHPCVFLRRRTSNGGVMGFYRDTAEVGTIAVTTTATAFNTSSDYRLKQNVEPLVGGLQKLSALAPKTFEFKSEPDVKVDGFIAHEVQAIVPQAVTGEKDGEKMQGLDMSKLVPVLVAAVQELSAKVEALEQPTKE